MTGVTPTADPRLQHQIDALLAVWQSITELLRGLEERQWKQPTELPGWTVQDVLSHIIGTERLLQGLPSAPPRDVETSWVRNAIGDFAENEVATRRKLAGADILREWTELRELREETLRNGDADYFAQPMQTPAGPGTMADFIGFRLLDCWLHEHDIRRALGLPALLAGAAAEHTIDRLARSVPMVVGKRAACPEGSAVELRIDGDVTRSILCEVQGGRAKFVDTPTNDPACSIAMDTEAFVILATGRGSASTLADRLAITGDVELGQRVVDGLNVMI